MTVQPSPPEPPALEGRRWTAEKSPRDATAYFLHGPELRGIEVLMPASEHKATVEEANRTAANWKRRAESADRSRNDLQARLERVEAERDEIRSQPAQEGASNAE